MSNILIHGPLACTCTISSLKNETDPLDSYLITFWGEACNLPDTSLSIQVILARHSIIILYSCY